MHPYFKLLGFKVKDVVTGFEGVAESISFDLYGCIQVVVRPEKVKSQAELPNGQWFDAKRLTAVGSKPVMHVPNFSVPENGPAQKPAPSRMPAR